jgi:16S rRNA (uracil1498-N3)-methyltransferase
MKIRLFYDNCDFGEYFIISPVSKFNKDSLFLLNHFHYIKNVLRCSPGDEIFLFNQKVECKYTILQIEKNKITLHKQQCFISNEKLNEFALIFSLIKTDKIILMLKQAVELGIKEIYPILTQNSQRINQFNEKKILLNIIEALEQSGGFQLPVLHKVSSICELLPRMQEWQIFYGALDNCDEKQNYSFAKKALLIGPEGGFTNEEIAFINSFKNVNKIKLGQRIMRSETASTALLSLLTIF